MSDWTGIGTPAASQGLASDLCLIADVKAWLGITAVTDDALITRLITAVSNFFRTTTGRIFDVEAYTETRSGNGQRTLYLRQYPIQSITVLVVNGVTIPAVAGNAFTLGRVGYIYSGDHITLLGYEFTRGMDNILISYSAGYPTIPYDLAQAAIELVCFKYKEKERIGHESKSLAGETVAFIIKEVPESVKSVLNKYNSVLPI